MEVMDVSSLLSKTNNLKEADIKSAIMTACLLVEREARIKCPVDTTELRESIRSDVKKTGNNIIGEVGTNKEYAAYVEYGTGLFAAKGNGRTDVPWHYKDVKGNWHTTSGQHPQPYLEPALNENRDKIKSIIKNKFKEEVKANV